MGLRVIIFTNYLMLSCAAAIGQSRADSMRTETSTDSLQVDATIETALKFYNTDLKKSLQNGQEALEQAKQIGYAKGIQEALSILSRIHRRLGNFSVAIDYNLQQITIAESRNDTTGVIDAYTTLGNIHSSLENYPAASSNLFQAYRIASLANAPNLSAIMNFIGRNYGKMNAYDSAHYWITKALDHELEFPQKGYALMYIYNNLAEIYLFEKDYQEAIHFYRLAEELPVEKTSPFGQTFTLNGIGQAYFGLHEYDKAIQAIEKSITISIRYGYRDKTKESYGILYEIYETRGDYKQALTNYKLFNIYQDSIFSEDQLQHIENLKINFETERIAHENEILRIDAELKDARIHQQKSYTVIAIVLTLSLLGALVSLFYSYIQNKRRNRLLANYNTNLEQQVERRTQELVKSNLELIRQNSQLEQFAYITAHNLRAPVARMLGLTNVVNLDTFDPVKDKPMIDSLRASAEQLDGIIYDMNSILDVKKGKQENYAVVDFNDHLTKVLNLLRESIESSHATISSDFSRVRSCFAIPAYIESILYNLISNSIKYRAKDRPPKILVTTSIVDGNLELSVKDNGIGMDLTRIKERLFNLYQRFHLDIEGRGMGLFLVKTQVEAMNGTIDVTSEINRGTTFRILFPLKMSNQTA